jgi:hypothetical protein
MRRVVILALALMAIPASGQTLTCEVSGAYCFDHHGYESTEQQAPGGYVHGWDNRGQTWTEWTHGGQTYTWPTSPVR